MEVNRNHPGPRTRASHKDDTYEWRTCVDENQEAFLLSLFVALLLVTLGPIISTTALLLPSPSPWQVPNACLTFFFSTLLVLVFILFPSGQFVPPWTGFLLVVFLVGQVSFFFPVAAAPLLPNNSIRNGYLVFLVEAAILVVVQLYRYRRVSSP